jgi:hypothetical protein
MPVYLRFRIRGVKKPPPTSKKPSVASEPLINTWHFNGPNSTFNNVGGDQHNHHHHYYMPHMWPAYPVSSIQIEAFQVFISPKISYFIPTILSPYYYAPYTSGNNAVIYIAKNYLSVLIDRYFCTESTGVRMASIAGRYTGTLSERRYSGL